MQSRSGWKQRFDLCAVCDAEPLRTERSKEQVDESMGLSVLSVRRSADKNEFQRKDPWQS